VRDGRSLEKEFDAMPTLPARDFALLRALVAGSLRWHHRLDWQLTQLSRTRPQKLDPDLRALLHVGLLQLQQFRIPDHAAVSATVDSAAELGLGRARGVVNAVLRRYLRERETLDSAAGAVDEARFSHPSWLIDAIRKDWPDNWEAVLEANNQPAPMWLRVNVLKLARTEYLALLEAAGMGARASELAPAALKMTAPCPVAELPGFAEGLVSVQDLAAQRCGALLELKAGQRVLDACAAPGGKTAQIAESEPNLDELIALDRDPARLETARANLARLGLSARLEAVDLLDTAAWWDGRPFQRILIDAPCSATGVVRRHPDIKVLRQPGDPGALATIQARMLDALWPLLEPGGRMVYATCSVLNEENRFLIAAACRRHADMRLSPFGSETQFRIRPGEAEQDGFYYACLRKAPGL
jgi:16S rRNA (cytosine967-C5)-methyltransferase